MILKIISFLLLFQEGRPSADVPSGFNIKYTVD